MDAIGSLNPPMRTLPPKESQLGPKASSDHREEDADGGFSQASPVQVICLWFRVQLGTWSQGFRSRPRT